MSNGSSGGGIALGGLAFATVVGALAVMAGAWFGGSYYYSQERLKVREQVLATAEWNPERVQREFPVECDAGALRAEAEEQMKDVSKFDLGKVDRFLASPNEQRARELARTVKTLRPALDAFLEAAKCQENGRLTRTGSEQRTSGPVLTRALVVKAWNRGDGLDDLRQALWVGRDIQASGGLYEFEEGAQVMSAAYDGLSHALEEGQLDGQLKSLQMQLEQLMAEEDSAQLHWRSGARVLLADLLGPEWDANPPTPLRARAILESMDEVIASLESMPDVAKEPFPARHQAMKKWVAEHDMSTWDQKFRGFGKAGVRIDGVSTRTHAYGRALYIGVGLRRYRKARGRCPRELEDLVEGGILGSIPIDPIANAPFTYDDKTCTVTSAAPPVGGSEVRVSAIPTER